ncbi:MAG: VOC family protein, partial [Clostridia bacterium]
EEDLESTYQDFKEKDVKFISPPKTMPWGQKTALFKDPDGNVHEIFTEIKK